MYSKLELMTSLINPSLISPSLQTRYPSWQQLEQHATERRKTTHNNTENPADFSLQAAGLTLDFSKNNINSETMRLFSQLYREAQIQQSTKQLFDGEKINHTEQRPAWHTALRSKNKPAEVKKTLERMKNYVSAIHNGDWRGHNGKKITTFINIGIGGSDLGPRMVCRALQPYQNKNIQIHFISNVDPMDLESVLPSLNPDTTLFIIASKSFTTLESLCNANKAKQWFTNQTKTTDISQHFIAVSSATGKAQQFGITSENIFPLWDWVGGRYSLCSAIGLIIALSIGWKNFELLLSGAQEMDEHFLETQNSNSTINNMPVLMAFLGLYYQHFFNANSHVLLPYDQSLQHFPAYLQQLDMESNGKHVNREGETLSYSSGPIIWGDVGTNGQHSFHQLLHQGTQPFSCDFILPLNSHSNDTEQHCHLVANCLAQSQAFTQGKSHSQAYNELITQGLSEIAANELAPHKVIAGNRPHNIIYFDKLTPKILGALIALYEHKTFVQGLVLNINSFDQWGVELGKELSSPLFEALNGKEDQQFDGATQQIIQQYKNANPVTK